MFRTAWFLLLPAFAAAQQPGWWMAEPIRWVQTNLRETDAALDPARLIRQLEEFPANTLLFGMGGITAFYPARIPLHYPSPYLPEGRDTFGEVLRAAHARKIRVVGRFDLSKTQKPVYDAHPEWFFKRANGDPAIYNGLYSTCINGEYYHGHALKILEEALERYEVDGLFFNMFGNPSTDYSGNPMGPCHCDACARKYRERHGRELPREYDATYREFLAQSQRDAAEKIAEVIHRKRPRAGFFTYIQQLTDGIMSESNTAVGRPLPLWPYSASDNVNRARNSQPGKMAVNLCMSFVDFPWRFATVPQPEIRQRLYQNMAHGGALAFNMHGTPDQQDRSALEAARPVYSFHAKHEEYYVGQESAARVLLLGGRGNNYRGWFRLLTEQHIPFAVADNLEWIGKREFDLVIAAESVPVGVERWVRGGGALLAATAMPLPFGGAKVVKPWRDARSSYLRVRDRKLFPSLANTDLVLLDGEFAELEAPANPALTLVLPSMFGPPEKVHVDQKESPAPGVWMGALGSGRIVWLPWNAGDLYYRLSSEAHRGVMGDLVRHLLGPAIQLRTNAHPLVEMTLMRQSANRRTLLHLVNGSGHADTAYFEPVPMGPIRVDVAGEFRQVQIVATGQRVTGSVANGRTSFTVPGLREYELVALLP